MLEFFQLSKDGRFYWRIVEALQRVLQLPSSSEQTISRVTRVFPLRLQELAAQRM